MWNQFSSIKPLSINPYERFLISNSCWVELKYKNNQMTQKIHGLQFWEVVHKWLTQSSVYFCNVTLNGKCFNSTQKNSEWLREILVSYIIHKVPANEPASYWLVCDKNKMAAASSPEIHNYAHHNIVYRFGTNRKIHHMVYNKNDAKAESGWVRQPLHFALRQTERRQSCCHLNSHISRKRLIYITRGVTVNKS